MSISDKDKAPRHGSWSSIYFRVHEVTKTDKRPAERNYNGNAINNPKIGTLVLPSKKVKCNKDTDIGNKIEQAIKSMVVQVRMSKKENLYYLANVPGDCRVDFDAIKASLKTYLQGQSQFSDFNFDGSALSTLLDLLAYNTHYNAFHLNH